MSCELFLYKFIETQFFLSEKPLYGWMRRIAKREKNRSNMTFGHEKVNVYRLSIGYIA